MTILYKENNVNSFQSKFLAFAPANKERNFYYDEKYGIENIFEPDTAFLLIGVPNYSENIINGENAKEGIIQLSKFCQTKDFLLANELFEPIFISSLIKLINTDDSLSFELIILIKNMWEQLIESRDILFNNELVSSFCKYLCVPFEFRDFVFEAFYFLLKNIPQDINQDILGIIIEHHVFDSLNDFFDIINTIDFSQFALYQRIQVMIERTMFLIRSLAFNTFLNSDFYSNLINYSLIILSKDESLSHKSISISILYHIIIELNEGQLFASNDGNIQILLNYHFFNDRQIFTSLYEIDSFLWNYTNFKSIYLSNNHFMNNIASLLINQNFKDFLKPIFLFLNSAMKDIWSILFKSYVSFGNDISRQLIYIILDRSNNDESLINKVYAGLCISSFMLFADMSEKRKIAFDGGFNTLCLLISTAEDFILKNMLKCILMLFSVFPQFLKDESNVNEIMTALENIDENCSDGDLYYIRYQIIQLVNSFY